MNAALSNSLNRLSSAMLDKAIVSASEWACRFRKMGKPYPGDWTFDNHPWLLEMHDCPNQNVVGRKAAQMGFSETAINRVFKAIDIDKLSAAYILPTSTPDAHDFSATRFDPALEASEHLQAMFSDVKNTKLKRSGSACLYIRSSRSKSQLKSFPAAILIMDEVDEFDPSNMHLIYERASGQLEEDVFIFQISTPTYEGIMIDARFEESDQRHYHFKCPCCSRWDELDITSLVVTAEHQSDTRIEDSHLICHHCKGVLPHETKSEWVTLDNCMWVPKHTERNVAGFHIPQFYSHTVHPKRIAKLVIEAESDPQAKKELYNSKFGKPYVPDGGKVTDQHLNNCIGSHSMLTTYPRDGFITMGVDIGKTIDLEIDEWWLDESIHSEDVNLLATPRVIKLAELSTFEELDQYMEDFNVRSCVIDLNPEVRKSAEFAGRFPGRVYRCVYSREPSARELIMQEAEMKVSVNRTSWMDVGLGRFGLGNIVLPTNLPHRYRSNLKSPTRIIEGGKAFYIHKEKEPDHYAHTRTYNEIALRIGLNVAQNKDIR